MSRPKSKIRKSTQEMGDRKSATRRGELPDISTNSEQPVVSDPCTDIAAQLRLIGDDFDREAREGIRRGSVHPTYHRRHTVAPEACEKVNLEHLGWLCHVAFSTLAQLYGHYQNLGMPLVHMRSPRQNSSTSQAKADCRTNDSCMKTSTKSS